MRYLPYMPAKPIHPLDKIGFVLFGSGFALLTLGLSMFSESHIQRRYPALMIFVACTLLLLYALHSRSKSHPIINIALTHIRTFRVALLGNLISRIGFGGIPFLLPLLLQISLHFSSEQSGFLLAPIALGVLVVKPISLLILRLLGYKKLLIGNALCISLSLCSFTMIKEHTSIYTISCLTFLHGFFIALQYTAMNSLAYANISQEHTGDATSIMSTIQQLAQSFGVAIAAIIIMLLSPQLSTDTPLTLPLFHRTFMIISCISFSSIVFFMSLKPEDGQELIHIHHPAEPQHEA